MNADNTPQFNHPDLAKLKPYLLVLLRKGEKYLEPETNNIIRNEHLPYVFKLKEQGLMSMTMPLREPESEFAALGILNTTDKAVANNIMLNDPAVQKKVFVFEILNSVGIQGDSLL